MIDGNVGLTFVLAGDPNGCLGARDRRTFGLSPIIGLHNSGCDGSFAGTKFMSGARFERRLLPGNKSVIICTSDNVPRRKTIPGRTIVRLQKIPTQLGHRAVVISMVGISR